MDARKSKVIARIIEVTPEMRREGLWGFRQQTELIGTVEVDLRGWKCILVVFGADA